MIFISVRKEICMVKVRYRHTLRTYIRRRIVSIQFLHKKYESTLGQDTLDRDSRLDFQNFTFTEPEVRTIKIATVLRTLLCMRRL